MIEGYSIDLPIGVIQISLPHAGMCLRMIDMKHNVNGFKGIWLRYKTLRATGLPYGWLWQTAKKVI